MRWNKPTFLKMWLTRLSVWALKIQNLVDRTYLNDRAVSLGIIDAWNIVRDRT
jgi:hypothetical protein